MTEKKKQPAKAKKKTEGQEHVDAVMSDFEACVAAQAKNDKVK